MSCLFAAAAAVLFSPLHSTPLHNIFMRERETSGGSATNDDDNDKDKVRRRRRRRRRFVIKLHNFYCYCLRMWVTL